MRRALTSGVMTMEIWSLYSGASWKVIDLPPPAAVATGRGRAQACTGASMLPALELYRSLRKSPDKRSAAPTRGQDEQDVLALQGGDQRLQLLRPESFIAVVQLQSPVQRLLHGTRF